MRGLSFKNVPVGTSRNLHPRICYSNFGRSTCRSLPRLPTHIMDLRRAVGGFASSGPRRSPVHNSPIGRVSQMCSVFLCLGWLEKWDWMNLVPLCKIAFAVFPLRNWTSGGCGCGVFGYLSRPSLVLPERMGFFVLVVVDTFGNPVTAEGWASGRCRGPRGSPPPRGARAGAPDFHAH